MVFETAKLTIDLDRIVQNYMVLKKTAPRSLCAATLKANAYGMGAVQVGKVLARAGCSTFFFAYMDEAIDFKQAVPEANRVFVLNGPYEKASWSACKQYGLTPVLNTLENVEAFKSFGTDMPVALHIDTGMNRLGMGYDDYKKIKNPPNFSLIMSHLACADDPLSPMNFTQLKQFKEIQRAHPHIPFSLCNSSGVFLGSAYHFDIVRPGCALYGINPTTTETSLSSCVHLEARILQIQTLSKGRTIGYNTTHTCETETRVATVALGYADGVPWQAWGKGAYLIICGKKAPILGRISMDLITVDVSHIPNCTTQDWATVMDKTLTPDYWAKVIQNSSYQVLLNLGNRASRVYVGANSCDLDTPKPHSSCGQKVDERSVY